MSERCGLVCADIAFLSLAGFYTIVLGLSFLEGWPSWHAQFGVGRGKLLFTLQLVLVTCANIVMTYEIRSFAEN